jgi:hypothetical protein
VTSLLILLGAMSRKKTGDPENRIARDIAKWRAQKDSNLRPSDS